MRCALDLGEGQWRADNSGMASRLELFSFRRTPRTAMSLRLERRSHRLRLELWPLATVLLSALALAGTQTDAATDSTPSSSERSRVHVMSYNIKGLPAILVGSQYKSSRYST